MTPGGRGAAAQGGEICVRTRRAPDIYSRKYKYVREQIQITLTKYRQIQVSTRLIKGTKTSTANLSSAHP